MNLLIFKRYRVSKFTHYVPVERYEINLKCLKIFQDLYLLNLKLINQFGQSLTSTMDGSLCFAVTKHWRFFSSLIVRQYAYNDSFTKLFHKIDQIEKSIGPKS
ncbi:hypothetical protein HZS_7997 [Henneguya salminicola]|nr:hypothetical protein HZS_7997 [Henneguya salminicola]